jgi:hypothetical protein
LVIHKDAKLELGAPSNALSQNHLAVKGAQACLPSDKEDSGGELGKNER